jgi:hypothetical protein
MRKRPKQKQESTEVGIDFWYAKFPRMMRKRPKQKQVCNVRLRRSKKFWHMKLFDCIRSQPSQQFVNSFRCMKSVSQEAHLLCGCPFLISSTELPTAIQERLGEQWSESLLSNVELRQYGSWSTANCTEGGTLFERQFQEHSNGQNWCVAMEHKQLDRNCSNETSFTKQVQSMLIVDYKVDGIFELDSVLDRKLNDLWHQCKSWQ